MAHSYRWTRPLALMPLLALTSCSPQKAALKLFTNQGLNLLEPARDYIKLGGIFVVPAHGQPTYLDPYDSPAGATPFTAIVSQQDVTGSADAQALLGTLGNIVPVPVGLQFSRGTQIELDQIEVSGTRYASQTMEALIRMPATNAAILKQLNAGTRVFVIQEVDTAKSLSVKSSSNTDIAATIEGGAAIPNCGSSNSASSSAGASAAANGSQASSKTATANSSTTSGNSTPSPTNASQGPAVKTESSGAKQSSSTGASVAAASSQQGSTATGSGGAGFSVGACFTNQYTLSFQSDTAIPFAVRLNEVDQASPGVLEIQDQNFQPPSNALGGSTDVSASAFIEKQHPLTLPPR